MVSECTPFDAEAEAEAGSVCQHQWITDSE